MPTIIIPVRGMEEMTHECIAAIKKHVKDPDVIVVDNSGGFYEKGIACIEGGNWGFAKSVTVAAGMCEGDLLLMNNDVLALTDFVTPMQNLAGGRIGVVGAMLIYPDGRIQHIGSVYDTSRDQPAYHPHKGERPETVEDSMYTHEVQGVTFACGYITRECWEDLNGVDVDAYPFAYEDIDFCLRARERGWKVYYCAEARLIHKEHVTQRKHLREARKRSNKSYENLRARWG